MLDTTTDYGKQAYFMCEDLATQLNFLKNKQLSNSSSSGDSSTDTSTSNSGPQTMLELLGGVATGTLKKRYLTYKPTANQNFKYTVLLKVTNASQDGQFDAHIFFDGDLVGKKVFMVSGTKANVLFDFEYTSSTGEIEVEIFVSSGVESTEFCLDQIITISNDAALTCDYPNRHDDDACYKLSLSYLGEPNKYGLSNAYSVAFEQDNMLYTSLLEAKHFDMQRLTFYAKSSPYNFNAFSTIEPLSDGSVGFGSGAMSYSTSSRTYCYNHNTKAQKATSMYLQYADVAPFSRSGNSSIETQGIMKYNQAYAYDVMSLNLNIVETYPIDFAGYTVNKVAICKPRTVQEAQTNLPILMIDSNNVAHIYYNYLDAQAGLSFNISNVSDICCVYGSSLTELMVYVSLNGTCYVYKLNYTASTRKFTQQSRSKLGTFSMYYPGFGDDAFYVIDNKIYFTKHQDLL